jgi:hypothetical protein
MADDYSAITPNEIPDHLGTVAALWTDDDSMPATQLFADESMGDSEFEGDSESTQPDPQITKRLHEDESEDEPKALKVEELDPNLPIQGNYTTH